MPQMLGHSWPSAVGTNSHRWLRRGSVSQPCVLGLEGWKWAAQAEGTVRTERWQREGMGGLEHGASGSEGGLLPQ